MLAQYRAHCVQERVPRGVIHYAPHAQLACASLLWHNAPLHPCSTDVPCVFGAVRRSLFARFCIREVLAWHGLRTRVRHASRCAQRTIVKEASDRDSTVSYDSHTSRPRPARLRSRLPRASVIRRGPHAHARTHTRVHPHALLRAHPAPSLPPHEAECTRQRSSPPSRPRCLRMRRRLCASRAPSVARANRSSRRRTLPWRTGASNEMGVA